VKLPLDHDYCSREVTQKAKRYKELLGFVLDVLTRDALYVRKVVEELERKNFSSDVFVNPTVAKKQVERLELASRYLSYIEETKYRPLTGKRKRKFYELLGFLSEFFKKTTLRHGTVRKYAKLLLQDYERVYRSQVAYLKEKARLDSLKALGREELELGLKVEKLRSAYICERIAFARKHGAYVEGKLASCFGKLKDALREVEELLLEVIGKNQRLVAKVANDEFRKRGSRFFGYFEEAVQVGNLALLLALEKYEPSKGAFSTVAYYWVRRFIEGFLREEEGRNEESIAKELYGNKTLMHYLKSDVPVPEEVVVRKDALEKVRNALKLLAPKEREAVVLLLKGEKLNALQRDSLRRAIWKLKRMFS